ncbi:MAG: hypothetical protein JNK05_05765 [Myxococcales bacterium]|nr:hypothetical protein [Myxococcales bacterium]
MKHWTLAPIALLSLVACNNGSGNTTVNNQQQRAQPSGNEQRTVVAQDDVSEVAAPAELVALVRATSVRAIASRIARYGFVSDEQANGVAGEILSQALGNDALSRLVQTDRPMDAAVVFAGGRPSFVVSLAVAAPQSALQRLGRGFRSRPLGNGVIEVTAVSDEPNQRPQRNGESKEMAAPSREEPNVCFISPTPRANEGRLTCTTGARSALELVTPFLARSLTRRDSPANAIVATVFPTAIRAMISQDVTRGFDEADQEIEREIGRSTEPPFNHADVRQPIVRFAHEFIANSRSIWNETAGLDLTVTFDDQRVRLVGSGDVHNPTASYVRALIEGSRNAPPLPEQYLQRFPSDVAVVFAGASGRQTMEPFVRPLTDIAVALGRNEARLPAPMLAQLQEILPRMFTSEAGFVGAVSADPQGRGTGTFLLRFTDAARATGMVTDYRRLLAIVRNPAFTRAIDTLARRADVSSFSVNWRQVRELPARGFPAGSFAFELPDFSAMANASRSTPPSMPGVRAPRPARPAPVPPLQYLIVPEGAYVTTISAPDVRARWAELSARTGPALDLAAHGARAGAISMSFVPAGFPNLVARQQPRSAADMRATIGRMPDRGATPIVLRMSNAEVAGNQRFTLEIEVQSATLTGLAQAMR